jgi:DME family drug/metabolite transporter
MKIQAVAQGSSTYGLLLIVLSALLWGTVGVAVKAIYGLADTNPLSIGFLRLAISVPALFLAGWLVLGGRMFRVVRRRDLAIMLLLGVMVALYQVCYFGAIAQVGVAIAVLVTLCTAPVLVALLSLWLFREKLTSNLMLALACALLGTVLLVSVQPNTAGVQSNTAIGVLLALGSAFGYAVITLCSRLLAGRYHPLQSLTIGFGTGAIILLPFALLSGFVISYPVVGWLLLLYLGLIPTVLAYVLFLSGLRYTTATAASITTLLEPMTSTLLAGLFFKEQLGLFGLLGGILLLGSIVLLFRTDFRQG